MALKLDDLLIKKKDPVQILDLSTSTANSKDELRKLLEKVPEFKIKMEKVKAEDLRIYDKKFCFKTSKKELKPRNFPFVNPVPSEMKSLRLDDLYSVGIQWKMLTSLRPKSKLDEEYYSKMIQLGKLQLATREKEKKTPLGLYIRKTKNRAGVLEMKIISCRECGEEFCMAETCRLFAYDAYERVNTTAATELTAEDRIGKEQRKKKRRKKKLLKAATRIRKKKKAQLDTKGSMPIEKVTEKLTAAARIQEAAQIKRSVAAKIIKDSFKGKLSKEQNNIKNSKSESTAKSLSGCKTGSQKSFLRLKRPKNTKIGSKNKSESKVMKVSEEYCEKTSQ